MLLRINVFRHVRLVLIASVSLVLEEAWEIWSRIHPLGTEQQSFDGTYTRALLVPVLQSLFVPSIDLLQTAPTINFTKEHTARALKQ